ncbi:MAG: alpha-amylase, partial [Muribaculaceae bacterium]|nr:alpha-amylase [Muribaculaceae bacterium]
RATPDRLVTWVESHDTYCNQNESAGLTDEQIRAAWVFLTARQNGTPLFFSRPMNSTRENYWGDNRAGARGNDEFKHPEVVAANKFRHAMSGQPETLISNQDGTVAEVARGNNGIALINVSDKKQEVEMPTTLPDGNYNDEVNGKPFTVSNGIIKGTLSPLTSYIIYK